MAGQVCLVNRSWEKVQGLASVSRVYTRHQNMANNLIRDFLGHAPPTMYLPATPPLANSASTTMTTPNFRSPPCPRIPVLVPRTTTLLVACPPASKASARQGSADCSVLQEDISATCSPSLSPPCPSSWPPGPCLDRLLDLGELSSPCWSLSCLL